MLLAADKLRRHLTAAALGSVAQTKIVFDLIEHCLPAWDRGGMVFPEMSTLGFPPNRRSARRRVRAKLEKSDQEVVVNNSPRSWGRGGAGGVTERLVQLLHAARIRFGNACVWQLGKVRGDLATLSQKETLPLCCAFYSSGTNMVRGYGSSS